MLLKPQASLFVVAIALLLRLLMPCLRLHHRPSYVRFFPSSGLIQIQWCLRWAVWIYRIFGAVVGFWAWLLRSFLKGFWARRWSPLWIFGGDVGGVEYGRNLRVAQRIVIVWGALWKTYSSWSLGCSQGQMSSKGFFRRFVVGLYRTPSTCVACCFGVILFFLWHVMRSSLCYLGSSNLFTLDHMLKLFYCRWHSFVLVSVCVSPFFLPG